ncbi:hypothetical protein OZX74_07305 [Bifidobacterium sp. ESL0798]|uniref:hypothetical protein n=1 Tax=Bifidobacterium sp. ESL0798 TaxID=2983235 RepID=UPI0023FA301A|nr:hypothetical protein [Bifidobacterium sp. ESL0798]WEV73702.1 hypothetical protein OZX74_07305 [Bifidobacterium sp. ESL0798]
MNVTYERSGCKQFFKKHRDDEKTIKSCIEKALGLQLETGMSKVKRAVSARVGGQCVYECRINLKRTGSARVAFIVNENDNHGNSNHPSNEENSTFNETNSKECDSKNSSKQGTSETSKNLKNDGNVNVLFISSVLQKDEFTHMLERDLKEAGLCD